MSFVVAVSGPTASGKSDLAIEIALRFNGEVVNADSVQVYQEANIGSAKITTSEMKDVPHHLLSIHSPDYDSNAAEFCRMADETIADVSARDQLPVLAGGTGLYLRSLLCGLLDEGEIPESVIADVDDRLAAWGEKAREKAYDWLLEIDSVTAAELVDKDPQRLRRALIFNLANGRSLLEAQREHALAENKYSALVICLFPNREKLYQRINKRVDQMLEKGLIDEVKKIRDCYGASAKVLEAIGYRHVALWLDAELEYKEMVELLKRDTRRFAKRQLTWWRNQPQQLGWKILNSVNFQDNPLHCLEFVSEEISREIGSFKNSLAENRAGNKIAFLPVVES